MRSRYTAYVLGDTHWLWETWHPATRRMDMGLDPAVRWLGLEVLAREDGGPEDTKGVVEFVARYKVGGRAHRLRERSRFQRPEGRWVYVAGDPADSDP
jgi:SEC-C motif-containing protein